MNHLTEYVADTMDRILKDMKDDWDGYGSPVPTSGQRSAALEFLGQLDSDQIPCPRIVPVCGGGIQLEWEMGDKFLEVEFTSICRIGFLKGYNRERLTDLLREMEEGEYGMKDECAAEMPQQLLDWLMEK